MAYSNAGKMQPSQFKSKGPASVTAAQGMMLNKSRPAPRSSVKMSAAPRVSGDIQMNCHDDHFDKAMVAKMGINGFGRIGRLVFRSTFMGQ